MIRGAEDVAVRVPVRLVGSATADAVGGGGPALLVVRHGHPEAALLAAPMVRPGEAVVVAPAAVQLPAAAVAGPSGCEGQRCRCHLARLGRGLLWVGPD